MAYSCGCGYKTSKGGKAVDKHEQKCGANKKAKLFNGDRSAKSLNKPKK